ncbi:DUF4175 domain-containing protein [Hymenobacter tibetensis]|uniref:DUF4175 domain-containing protein n=1 Tax=Hymenobacter tibetensis TaxID=497967 RepID=A0ABY4D073_9BACT|nr:DUF4175 domain-containing protein [Hymenobacter tibetensis]UOG75662.1 DUF4175 domain-containing protein [Hymenobacter tibetensis]
MSVVATSSAPGRQLLHNLGQRDANRRTLALLLPLVAAAVAIAAWARHWPAASLLFGGLLAALLLGGVYGVYRLRQLRLVALAQRLDRLYPALEDSTGLLLRDEGSQAPLNLLEQLQQQRIQTRLETLQADTPQLLHFSWRPALFGTGALLLLAAASLLYRPTAPVAAAALPVHFPAADAPTRPGQPVAPKLLDTRLRVLPPAYTRRLAFTPGSLSFSCPAGSRVRWTARVNRPAGAAPMLELGSKRYSFRAVAGQPTEFVVELPVTVSTLYRLRFAGQTSDDYALDVVPDQAPTLKIETPKPYTLIEFGQSSSVPVRVALRDDYGLSEAQLVATVAQGQGEAVKFKEVITTLTSQLRGQPRQATLSTTLRLPALGLTYGDEVYFYVRARDNARHLTRSDTYLVQWEDTTVQDGLTDMSMSVNVVPAYFRSQRQIIIDTEKLMAERASLPAATFAERANNLGFDQKMLRLRYGKFLGEESESGSGAAAPRPPADADSSHQEHAGEAAHSADDGHDHSAAATPPGGEAASNNAELMEPYMHRHDDEETADFLEPAVKAKLRGVLNQMWEAELRLRLAKPAEARPYEYRALRLLKQVQQQTRAYVRKSGFEPPVLPEATARLSGDLAGAATPRLQQQTTKPATQPEIREALRLLAALRAGQPARPADAVALERAGQAVAQAALQKPGAYLAAVRALRQLATDARTGHTACTSCFAPAEMALTALLPAPPAAPVRTSSGSQLSQRYFQNLTSR